MMNKLMFIIKRIIQVSSEPQYSDPNNKYATYEISPSRATM